MSDHYVPRNGWNAEARNLEIVIHIPPDGASTRFITSNPDYSKPELWLILSRLYQLLLATAIWYSSVGLRSVLLLAAVVAGVYESIVVCVNHADRRPLA